MVDLRPDLELIGHLIPERSRVLDLGCGGGELLQLLAEKDCEGTGVEMEPSEIVRALAAGVNVIDLDLNTQLDEFGDDSYDVVVLSRTLQNVHKPREVLRQIARIAVHSVVSMPNFVHWRNRLRLLGGHMPISRDLPFEWYDTPNLHYTSLADLEPLFGSLDLRVDRRIPLDERGNRHPFGNLAANLFASSAVYLLHAPRSAEQTRSAVPPRPSSSRNRSSTTEETLTGRGVGATDSSRSRTTRTTGSAERM